MTEKRNKAGQIIAIDRKTAQERGRKGGQAKVKKGFAVTGQLKRKSGNESNKRQSEGIRD